MLAKPTSQGAGIDPGDRRDALTCQPVAEEASWEQSGSAGGSAAKANSTTVPFYFGRLSLRRGAIVVEIKVYAAPASHWTRRRCSSLCSILPLTASG